jgi:hypothetical protein
VDRILKRRLIGNQHDDPPEQCATACCSLFAGLVIFCLLAGSPFGLSWAFRSQETRGLPPALHGPRPDQPADRAANPNDDLGQLGHIESHITQGKYQEVVSPLEAYLEEHPHSPRGYFNLGYTTLRKHDPETTNRNLLKCLSLTPPRTPRPTKSLN